LGGGRRKQKRERDTERAPKERMLAEHLISELATPTLLREREEEERAKEGV
jgi:hypothetical protein